MRFAAPRMEEYRPFENEAVSMWRSGQPVEQALENVVRQDELKLLGAPASELVEALPDRRGDVAGRPSAHAMASR